LGATPSECSVLVLLTTVPCVERCLELRGVRECVPYMDLLCRGVVYVCTVGLNCLTVGVRTRLSLCRLNLCRVGFRVRSSRSQCECVAIGEVCCGVSSLVFDCVAGLCVIRGVCLCVCCHGALCKARGSLASPLPMRPLFDIMGGVGRALRCPPCGLPRS
jgi:hypothetical protein